MTTASTFLFCLLGAALPAVEVFVSPTGDDRADGARERPWLTIQRAVDTAGPGDTVTVLPGAYADAVVTVTKSGAEGRPLTVRSAEKHLAKVGGFMLRGDHVAIDGFDITNPAKSSSGIHAGSSQRKDARTGSRITNNLIHDLDGTGITTGVNAIVRGNLMRRVHRGIFANSGTLVEGNEVDTLTAPIVDKRAEGTKPARRALKKTQYAFFAGDDITFRGNYWHGSPHEGMPDWGVDFFVTWDAGGTGPSNRILIEGNRCFDATHGSECEAPTLKQSSGITYRNNLFVNTVYVGILSKHWQNVTIEHNTFINCGAYPVWFASELQCRNAVVRNNLIATWKQERQIALGWTPAEAGVRINEEGWRGLVACDFNLFQGYKNRGYGPHDATAEFQFVDPEHGDFRLKPGSSGIDAGTVSEAVKLDLLGHPRVQGKAPDVGCYESAP